MRIHQYFFKVSPPSLAVKPEVNFGFFSYKLLFSWLIHATKHKHSKV